jgi:hypothetical protein
VSDEPFDDVDRAIAHGLSALAPEVGDGDETLAALRPQFRRARTRRRAAGIGVSLVAVVALGSVAVLAAPGSRHRHVQVSGPSTSTHSTTRSSTRVSTTTRPRSSSSSTSPTTARTSSPSTPSNPAGGLQPGSPTAVPTTSPNNGHGGPGPSGGDDGHGGPGNRPTTTSVPSDSGVHTYRSAGGSVKVRFVQGRLQLLSTPAADGYHASVNSAQPDDVDVRFDSDHGGPQWRVRVRVDHDGHLSAEVTQS